ncbi:NfeD family protein [Curtobacterium ammoniigenes]|uniref:NfeD family protein n=1 Tax=Curtobacterium ammoniigenes TaxID=395387 RepID=UPI00082F0753|nr:NfeD family protein [Curtobacterium ammoniigenes]
MSEIALVWTIIWIVVGLALGVIEIFALDFIFLMLAVGAAGGLVSILLGLPWWASVIIAALVALLLLGLVRPRMLRLLSRGADPRPTNVSALIGMPGIVAVAFTPYQPGQVRLANGETWSARLTGEPDTEGTPPLGTRVTVVAIEGSTAVVRPAERNVA